jgi:hypothetical protein
MFTKLAAHFPREAVSWRAQSVTKDGTKAMALAYIDARDVMRRLDEVVGPSNWSDSYIAMGNGTCICTLSIRLPNPANTASYEWVSKSDGAGSTDVEAEKGQLSDAFKRAAVKWGIGRYLDDMPAPWVPCETSEYNGKKQWKAWKGDPWSFVRSAPVEAATARVVPNDTNPGKSDPGGADDLAEKYKAWCDGERVKIETAEFDRQALADWDAANRKFFKNCEKHSPDALALLKTTIEMRHAALDAFNPIVGG